MAAQPVEADQLCRPFTVAWLRARLFAFFGDTLIAAAQKGPGAEEARPRQFQVNTYKVSGSFFLWSTGFACLRDRSKPAKLASAQTFSPGCCFYKRWTPKASELAYELRNAKHDQRAPALHKLCAPLTMVLWSD
jgi:hypothetical protein